MLDVSVIIVNYNTKDLVAACIESIIRHTYGITYEVIVVDNGSSDGSIEVLDKICKSDSRIRLVQAKRNVGFGRANNLGAKQARGRYLFLLNSDTRLLNNSIRIFYEKAESGYRNYILGSYLLGRNCEITYSYSDLEDIPHLLVRMLYLYIPPLLTLRMKLFPLKYECLEVSEKDVGFITGADMFLLRRLFIRLGGFDRNIFMYGEDEDFSAKAWQAGVRSRIILGPRIVHLDGASSKSSKTRRKMKIKSYKYLLRKAASGKVLLRKRNGKKYAGCKKGF